MAEKELFHNIERTYDLYFQLLQLSIEITNYATERIEIKRNKLRPTPEDLNPNTRFIDNSFIRQLTDNVQFTTYLAKQKLSWVNYPDIVKGLFEDIEVSEFYISYMTDEQQSCEHRLRNTIQFKYFPGNQTSQYKNDQATAKKSD